MAKYPKTPNETRKASPSPELEFNEAQRLGRPILLFLMSDDHNVKPRDVEPDPTKRDKLTAFKNRAKNISADSKVHRVYDSFDSLEDFHAKAIQSVADLQRHLEPKSPPELAKEVRQSTDPIPAPPSLYAEPRYLVSHEFIGRQAQLDSLNDWAIPSDPHPIIFFDAIGGTGKSMLPWHWLNHHAPKVRPYLVGRQKAEIRVRKLPYVNTSELRAAERVPRNSIPTTRNTGKVWQTPTTSGKDCGHLTFCFSQKHGSGARPIREATVYRSHTMQLLDRRRRVFIDTNERPSFLS